LKIYIPAVVRMVIEACLTYRKGFGKKNNSSSKYYTSYCVSAFLFSNII